MSNIITRYMNYGYSDDFGEDPRGEWVRYDDIKELIGSHQIKQNNKIFYINFSERVNIFLKENYKLLQEEHHVADKDIRDFHKRILATLRLEIDVHPLYQPGGEIKQSIGVWIDPEKIFGECEIVFEIMHTDDKETHFEYTYTLKDVSFKLEYFGYDAAGFLVNKKSSGYVSDKKPLAQYSDPISVSSSSATYNFISSNSN